MRAILQGRIETDVPQLPLPERFQHLPELRNLNDSWMIEAPPLDVRSGRVRKIYSAIRRALRRAVLSVLSRELLEEQQWLVDLVRLQNEIAIRGDHLEELQFQMAAALTGLTERLRHVERRDACLAELLERRIIALEAELGA